MNEVTLKITGTQELPDGEKDKIEITTQGKYYKKQSCFFIIYDESQLTGMEGSTTTLKIEKDKIMMKRFGNNESKLIFESSKTHKSIYQTIYGNMEMEVITEKIKLEPHTKGIRELYISYTLKIADNTSSKNTLSVLICHSE